MCEGVPKVAMLLRREKNPFGLATLCPPYSHVVSSPGVAGQVHSPSPLGSGSRHLFHETRPDQICWLPRRAPPAQSGDVFGSTYPPESDNVSTMASRRARPSLYSGRASPRPSSSSCAPFLHFITLKIPAASRAHIPLFIPHPTLPSPPRPSLWFRSRACKRGRHRGAGASIQQLLRILFLSCEQFELPIFWMTNDSMRRVVCLNSAPLSGWTLLYGDKSFKRWGNDRRSGGESGAPILALFKRLTKTEAAPLTAEA